MIREAGLEDSGALLAICAGQPGAGVQPAADWELQQQVPALGWRFYLVGRYGALRLGGTHGRATLCGSAEDPEELVSFLDFCGVERLTSGDCRLPGFEKTESLWVMERPPGPAQMPTVTGYDPAPPMAAVLEVLESSDGRMLPEEVRESFEADNRVRRNRGFAAIRGIWGQGRLLSTAGAYGITAAEAYIACVETRPEARGRGLAGALVQSLCADYAGRTLALMCRREMAGYYERFGFVLRQSRVCFYKRVGG